MTTLAPHPPRLVLPLALLLVVVAGAGAWLEPRLANRTDNAAEESGLAQLLGQGRRLFANHAFIKADVYFHSGNYPTIFDNRSAHQTPHLAEDAGAMASRNEGDEHSFLGPPLDWIDAHNRQHFPSRHTHLGEDAPGGNQEGGTKEILPWLKLAAELDPNQVEFYCVAAYWLRDLKKLDQAEAFLRQGLRANPNSPEILFELGRSRAEAGDPARARNLWEGAWQKWQAQEAVKPAEQQNRFLAAQVLLNLAQLESENGRRDRCLHWLKTARDYAVSRKDIEQRIADVQAGLPFGHLAPTHIHK